MKILYYFLDVQWNDNSITSTQIKSSFTITDLDNNIDKSEDYLFIGFKTLREETMVGKDKDINNNEIEDLSKDEEICDN